MINLSLAQIRALLACADSGDFHPDGRYVWIGDKFAFATNRVVALIVRVYCDPNSGDGYGPIGGFCGVPVESLAGLKSSVAIHAPHWSDEIMIESPCGQKSIIKRDGAPAPNIHKIIPEQISGQAAYMSATTWALAEKVRKLIVNKGERAKPPALWIRPNGMDAPSIIDLGNPDYLMLAAPCKMAIDGPWDRPDWI